LKHSNTVFHQLLKYLPRHRFQEAVDRHQGDRRIRSMSCWDQLTALLFGQLTGSRSLRDLVTGFNSKSAHHYHLGTRTVRRSSLSDANSHRPTAVFQETFFYLLEQVRNKLPKCDASEMVRLIDSSTIDLNLNQFEWADFRSTKAGIKLHTVYDPNAEIPVYFAMTNAKVNDRKALHQLPMMAGMTYVVDRAYNDYAWYYTLTQQGSVFVGRMKKNALYEVLETKPAMSEGILSDEVIQLSSRKAKKACPTPMRRIKFCRKDDGKILEFITNDMQRSAQEIADLYKQRWQIELFFKWIKQNLKVKTFIGRSENAVMIQVLVALITYLLLKLAQLGCHSKMGLQSIVRLIGINLTSRRSLIALLQPDPGPNSLQKNEDCPQQFGLIYA